MELTSFQLIELIANGFSILAVWLTVRQNVLSFPVGIVGILAYAWMFSQQGLYGNLGLQAVFVAQNLYGWYHWLFGRGGEKRELPITRLTWVDRIWWLMAVGMIFPAMGWIFLRLAAFGWFSAYARPELAYADAFTMTISLLAQWLVTQKKVENWLLWLVANAAYIGMFLFLGMWLSAGTYVIFWFMAIWGWNEWVPLVVVRQKKQQ